MGEHFSCRLAFVDMGAVICMEQIKRLKKRQVTRQSVQDTAYVEISVYFTNTK